MSKQPRATPWVVTSPCRLLPARPPQTVPPPSGSCSSRQWRGTTNWTSPPRYETGFVSTRMSVSSAARRLDAQHVARPHLEPGPPRDLSFHAVPDDHVPTRGAV